MTKQELQDRTKQFSLRVLRLVSALPSGNVGWTLGKQLCRSGTSVGANYRAACKSRSDAEFIAKIGVCEEEADESAFWMELIMEDGLLPKSKVDALHDEAMQLTRILGKSRVTASVRNRKSEIGNRKSK